MLYATEWGGASVNCDELTVGLLLDYHESLTNNWIISVFTALIFYS